jgi:hypothetical protein
MVLAAKPQSQCSRRAWRPRIRRGQGSFDDSRLIIFPQPTGCSSQPTGFSAYTLQIFTLLPPSAAPKFGHQFAGKSQIFPGVPGLSAHFHHFRHSWGISGRIFGKVIAAVRECHSRTAAIISADFGAMTRSCISKFVI